ncbi:GLY1 Low-specificity L-threonine aldolase [Candida maltosa Xu316]|uniref:low-specificity L-threonine aldolase n=1 Tax=Candida maltosa (strain Xu316) TaxID=1245528 RepID=M3K4L0_CANMX|nr:Threonine aldolase [Candida maltosa Xu316]
MTADEEENFTTYNEFRSDTFTVPTRAMIEEGFMNATYGDSVYLEDEMTLKLENKMRELTGKPAALFCVSGTLSNQIGLRANLVQPPYSILCDHRSHVFLHEAGGLATLSQAMVHPVKPENKNYLTLEDILDNVTYDDGDIHAAPTKVISLENTLHGIIMPIEEIKRISEFCRENDIKLHLDGARLWNASVATGISMKEYCSYFDSVSICLSKSLGAPMGSVLVGEEKFILKANHFKKQNGGGVRQAGIMTSMAIHAIDYNLPKLKRSHDYAKQIGDFCTQHGIKLESPVDTSLVFLDLKANKMDPKLLIELGRTKYNVKLMGQRIACHFQLSQQSVDNVKKCILECYEYNQKNPHKNDGKNNKKLYNFDAIKKEVVNV